MSASTDLAVMLNLCIAERKELRELNAELLTALKGILIYKYCLPSVIVAEARELVAKAEKDEPTT